MPGRSSLRPANVDVRRSKRHQHNPRSLILSQTSSRSRFANIDAIKLRRLFFTDRSRLHRCYPKRAERRFVASAESRHRKHFSGSRGMPHRTASAKYCGRIGETYVNQEITSFTCQSALSLLCCLLRCGRTACCGASASDAERLEKLEQAVEELQKRNAELEAEVAGLRSTE